MRPIDRWCIGLTWLVLFSAGSALSADEDGQAFSEQVSTGFEYRLRVLGFGTATAPADAPRNPDNRIMNISRFGAAFHLRPDFKLDWRDLTLVLQPRAELQWETWREGPADGDQRWSDTTYIHQWLVRGRAGESLHLSYGRENLQWGPAYLTSLSNPFFFNNGRANPKIEVPAMDFARAVWVPNVNWSVSLIANTNPGRNPQAEADFSERWALKADYSGSEDYAGLIVAARERNRRQIGGFYGRTVSDGLLLYAEGALLQNPSGLYPEYADIPFGVTMREADNRGTFRGTGLAGGGYTLTAGPTLSIEYLYYGPGYNGAEAERFFDLQAKAATVIAPPNDLTPPAYAALARTADPGLRFLRRNYLMLQYLQSDIAQAVDLTVRWTRNLDDGSGRLTSIVEWSLTDHLQLFGIGTLNRGTARSEFGSIFDHHVMLGMEYIF